MKEGERMNDNAASEFSETGGGSFPKDLPSLLARRQSRPPRRGPRGLLDNVLPDSVQRDAG